jgi:hypothetical protein
VVTLSVPAEAGPLVQVCTAPRTQATATLAADRPDGQSQIDLLPNNIAQIYRIPLDEINFQVLVEQFDLFLVRSLFVDNEVHLELRAYFPVERLKATITPDSHAPAQRAFNQKLVNGFGNLYRYVKRSVEPEDLIVLLTGLPPTFFQHFTEFRLFRDRLKVDDHWKNQLENNFNQSN